MTKNYLIQTAAATALLLGLSGAAFAESNTSASADELAAGAAQAQAEADLDAIAANRFNVIAVIVATWEADMGGNSGWSAEFTAALEGASNEELMAIQGATSYDAVRAILQGRDEPVSVEGLTGTEALGSLTSDLVYTPVVPCRIFDTRFDIFGGPGGGNPGTQLDYYVHGSNALLAPQGHTAGTGCTSPIGEPVAVAANFTVVPYGKGHIRAWPYLGAQPNASFLNYNSTVNSNLANAGIVATCYLCGLDMSVSTWFGSSDSLADVMGYFGPAIIAANSVGMAEIDSADLESGNGTGFNSATLVSGANYILQPSFVANATGKCMVVSSMDINTATTDIYDGTFIRTASKIGAAAATNDGQRGHYAVPAGETHASSVTVSQVYNVTGGTTYQFGCYASTGGDFVGNTAYCRTSWICF